MRFTSRIPWRDKIDNSPPPKVVDVPPGTSRWGAGKMLISCPSNVEKKLKTIPKGTVVTTRELRNQLARDANADFTCPLTTGIFLKIVANAAEDERESKKDIAPYWRVVKEKGELNSGYPGGAERQAELLKKEGVKIRRKEKKLFASFR